MLDYACGADRLIVRMRGAHQHVDGEQCV
jgi:hypothetical protein